MKTTSSWVAAGLVLVGLACLAPAPPAAAQPVKSTLQRSRLPVAQVATTFLKYIEGTGAYIGEANLTSRKAWAVTVGNPPLSAVNAGFKSQPVSSGGVLAQGRVTASFEVLQVLGTTTYVCLMISKSGAETGQFGAKQSGALNGPGPVTLVTDQFTMHPGVQYEARAFVVTMSDFAGGGINAGVVKVTEIKWE